MEEYRISKSREEIIKIVKGKLESESTLSLWQKDPMTGERSFKGEAKFSSIDIAEGIFSVSIDEKIKAKFNPALDTYFLLQVQDFAFKTKTSISYKKSHENLSFQIPHDMRLKELRTHPRHYCPPEEKRIIRAKFENKNNEEAHVDVACPIYNISRGGICIIVSKETLSNIQINKEIELEGLGFFENLSNKMNAVVKNARAYAKKGLRNDEFYALGLEFKA